MTNQLPAHLQGYQSRGLSKTVTENLGTTAPPYISLKDNRFTAFDAAGNEKPVGAYDAQPTLKNQFPGVYVDVNIIDINPNISRIFYDKPYDPSGSSFEPPACFSNNGVGPSKNAARPQGTYCATCRQSEWGSAISAVSGKEIPACAQYQFIAVTVPGFGTDMAFLIRIPPNSLKAFRGYSEIFNSQQFDFDAVVTRLSFSGQGTLAFAAVNYVDQPTSELRLRLLASNATDALLSKNDVARDPNTVAHVAAPQPVAQLGVPQQVIPPVQYQPVPMQAALPQVAQQPAAQAEAPKGRGRGRPRAEQPAPAAAPGPSQAPFRPQESPANTQAFGQAPAPFVPAAQAVQMLHQPAAPQATLQAAPQPGAPFGIQGGVAPNADVQNALHGVFGR